MSETSDLDLADHFVDRHIGPGEPEQARMLETLGFGSLDDLIDTRRP